MSELIPKDISTQDQEFRIEWSDGHIGFLPFHHLRCHCLCANCVDEWTREQILDPDKIPKDIKPVKANYVGRYALNIEWSDGHETGIYSFEYLRDLCQCKDCKKT